MASRRQVVRSSSSAERPAGDPGILPPNLARGPDPGVWAPPQPGDTAPGTGEFDLRGHRALTAWGRAANDWAIANGYGFGGYRDLLDPEVRYAVSARGRVHANRGGYVPPWERSRVRS